MESLRMCTVCRQMKPKSELIRIVKTSKGEVLIDLTQKADGRGAYVCKGECIEKLKKTRALNRAFKTQISDEIYDKILLKKEQ